ncbi:MAG TPA: cytochrome c [Thermodesulfobacteriota bacterium]|nr:cytochrome c [Thermodesulfobacteriota bacterium]
MKIFMTIVIVIFLLAVGVAAFTWSGIYNVAATDPHWPVTVWFLNEVQERSVHVHSKGISPPPLKDQKPVEIGFSHYHTMCRLCHGAPGIFPEEFAKGLNPKPPDLTSEDVRELSRAELYWVVKNGIKMTGMPAFGITHTEDELWAMVTLVNRLPDLTPEEYKAMMMNARGEGAASHHGGHHHEGHE